MQETNRSNTVDNYSADYDSLQHSNTFSTISPDYKPYNWTAAGDFSSPTESFDAEDLNDSDYDANSPDKIYLTVGDSVTVEHLEKVVGPLIQQNKASAANNAFLPPKPAKYAFEEIEFQRRSYLSNASNNSAYNYVTAMKQLGQDEGFNTRESMPSQSLSEYQGEQIYLHELIEYSHSRQASSVDDSNSYLALKDAVREAAKECSVPSGRK